MSDKLLNCNILHVRALVRYWEDAEVNGVPDDRGEWIPGRAGDTWNIRINLNTGRVLDWPENTTASIHYKVCDGGEYWLEDISGAVSFKWCGEYVPDRFLCHGSRGYGDYIILDINSQGCIENWSRPTIDSKDWIYIK